VTASLFRKWIAYQKATLLAERVFYASLNFPREEKYSLTDQVRRSSRSVCANLAEASAKRRYPKNWVSKFTDCSGETAETQVWLMFALDCEYIDQSAFDELISLTEEVARFLNYMIKNSKQFGAAEN
jgi:four helix bundle protein